MDGQHTTGGSLDEVNQGAAPAGAVGGSTIPPMQPTQSGGLVGGATPNPTAPQGEPVRELSLGERRVRINFNPDQDPQVAKMKALAAQFIDDIEMVKQSLTSSSEVARLCAIAQTEIETAAMYAVKAITS